GSNDEHMVSRVFFSLEIDGRKYENLHVDIKQPAGSNYESSPIEVYPPQGYEGPLDYEAFRKAVEEYYRSLVGSTGLGIHIAGGTNLRMWNNVFIKEVTVEFAVEEKDAAW
ncbi:MAG: hypothetical protein ACPLRH_03355, partial [Desulfotomaculales bacterium]